MCQISAIITTYNRPVSILNRAVQSVLKQTFEDYELIIVNDSPENIALKEAVESYIRGLNNPKIRYYCVRKNGGACRARNIGVKLAKGEYIAFLDDDDEWLSNKLALQYEIMEKDKSLGMVYCNHYVKSGSGKWEARKHRQVKDAITLLENNYIGSTSFPLIKKECLQSCGGFDTSLRSCQDWDMWLRILKKYPARICTKPLVVYYVSDDGITLNIKKQISGWKCFVEIYKEDYKRYPKALLKHYQACVKVLTREKHYEWAFVYIVKVIMQKLAVKMAALQLVIKRR